MSPTLVPSQTQENLAEDPLLVRLPRDTEGRPVVGGCHLVCNLLKGGMEAIYYALDARHDAEVAVRVLPLSLVDRDEGLNARLSDQARVAQALWSPFLVRVIDFGKDQGLHYVIMEYVAGESAGVRLRTQMMRGQGAMPEGEALLCAAGAALGLADIHAAGLVHRDVRPDNILIQRVGRPIVKLTGLGLAKPQGQGHAIGRQVHFAMGTPGFLAPEQAQDWRSAGPPADVFALGATLFSLLAGYPPFTGSSLLSILKATSEKDPDELPHTVRAPVRDFIMRCLQKKPERRFASGREAVDALMAIDPEGVAQAMESDAMEMPAPAVSAAETHEVASLPIIETEPPPPEEENAFTRMTVLPPPPEGAIRLGEEERVPAPAPTPPPAPAPIRTSALPSAPPPPAPPPLEKHTAQLEDWLMEPEPPPAPPPKPETRRVPIPPKPETRRAPVPAPPQPEPVVQAPPAPEPLPVTVAPPSHYEDRIPAPVPVVLTESAQRRYQLAERRRRRWATIGNSALIVLVLAGTLASVWFLFNR